MTIHEFSADLARRIPEMALDSPQNNSALIESLTEWFLKSQPKPKRQKVFTGDDDHEHDSRKGI